MSRLLTSLESFVRPSQSRYVGPSKLRRNVSATDNTRSRLHHRLGRNAKFCCKQRHYTSRAACLAAPELEKLAEVQVTQASTGLVVDAASLLDSGKVLLLPFMTHFGDFDSWEFALKLVDRMPELEEAGVEVVAFGIGSLAGARKFAVSTGFPMARLYADGRGAAANALGFSPGVGRKVPRRQERPAGLQHRLSGRPAVEGALQCPRRGLPAAV
uniref:Uncharacterized protein n=1 Tax=Tetraselmis sp. GSL018 TaxID=582737 RepID=A0A061S698_9CHLO|mmetsp:Transcript_26006/g.61873  ORF Transcript_26006/g.61873 Transcript_26006/m.61873 type:complete len:214 (+) Transcript_26006:482-1123(+)